MTDEQVEFILHDMEQMFGELPNHEHEPRRFASFVRLYQYYKSRESEQQYKVE